MGLACPLKDPLSIIETHHFNGVTPLPLSSPTSSATRATHIHLLNPARRIKQQ